MKVMIKKVFKSLFILSLLYAYIVINLMTHAVYYGRHTPQREGAEVDIMMLVDHFEWASTPEIEGLAYDIDGNNNISKVVDGQHVAYLSNIAAGEGKTEFWYSDTRRLDYKFDDRFELKTVLTEDFKRVDVSTIDETAIKQEIRAMVQPLLDRQPKPIINLQWLFDWLNRGRFQ